MTDLTKEPSGIQSRPNAVEGEVIDPLLQERALQARDQLKTTIEEDTGGNYLAHGQGHLTKSGRSFMKMPSGEDVSRSGASIFNLDRTPMEGIPTEVAWVEFNNINPNEIDPEAPYAPSNNKDELRLKLDPKQLPDDLRDLIAGSGSPALTNLLNDLRLAYHFFDNKVERRIRLPRHIANPNSPKPQIWEPASQANVWMTIPMTESDYHRATNTLSSLTRAISGTEGSGLSTNQAIARK